MRETWWRGWPILLVLLIVPALALSQAAQEGRTLVVSGQSGEAAVVEMDGKSYVELVALARLTHATLDFRGEQIRLTLPEAAAPSSAAPSGPPPASPGFSKDFLRTAIEEMAVIREWRSALSNCIENNYPVQDDWVEVFRGKAATNLVLLYSAASTDADRSALPLLNNEFENMKALSEKLLDARKLVQFVSFDSFNDDPLNQKVVSCASALAAMAVSGQFADDVSCH